MFHLWFNTGYIDNNYLCFQKSVLDKACKVGRAVSTSATVACATNRSHTTLCLQDKKSKHFAPGFKVEIFLHAVSGDDTEFELAKAVDNTVDADDDVASEED